MLAPSQIAEWRSVFRKAVTAFAEDEPTLILTHHDVDGLSSAAILQCAFERADRSVEVRILGRGENPWTEAVQLELREGNWGGLIVADLGTRPGVILPDTPTLIIDHHVPLGFPPGATAISGHGSDPTPTTGLLAWWCAHELGAVDHLLWLAALSIVGDMAEDAGFEELTVARGRYGKTALRNAVSLLNAARRAGAGNAQPAFELLLKAENPKDVTSGKYIETAALLEAKGEVAAAMEIAKRVAPKVKNNVALIMIDTPCQIHPLVAQQWKNRLNKNIVMVANKGYRPGWMHFSVRSATGVNLIEFLKENAPDSADENYGSGHFQATGGALTFEGWNEFISGLGFGAEMQIAHEHATA
ncbi:MAG: DHH family phosphoesterase [Limisphaerales bacterium]